MPATTEALRDGIIDMLTAPIRDENTRYRAEVLDELTWKQPLQQMEYLYNLLVDTQQHKVI